MYAINTDFNLCLITTTVLSEVYYMGMYARNMSHVVNVNFMQAQTVRKESDQEEAKWEEKKKRVEEAVVALEQQLVVQLQLSLWWQ